MRVWLERLGYELAIPPVKLRGRTRIHFTSEHSIERLLISGIEAEEADSLRRLLVQLGEVEVWELAHRDVVARLIDYIRWDRIWVLELEQLSASVAEEKKPEEHDFEEKPVELPWVSFQVVDNATDEPLADIPLLITLPGGDESEHTTNKEGWVEFDSVSKGTCKVRSELSGRDLLKTLAFECISASPSPRAVLGRHELWHRPEIRKLTPIGKRNPEKDDLRIANVRRYPVRDGDTMKSIAEKFDMSEEDLTLYNFGTTDEKELGTIMRREVGCTERDPESGKYVFTADDDPGIVYVPTELDLKSLSVDMSHILRVCRIEPEPPPFVFSI